MPFIYAEDARPQDKINSYGHHVALIQRLREAKGRTEAEKLVSVAPKPVRELLLSIAGK